MRKKMQKRNFTEELIVENAFKEALNIEKEQVQNICKDVKETEEHDARQHRKYIDAMENVYETQFSLLAESLAIEKKDAEERLKAQKKVMRMMQQEFRENLKKEIREMQKNTVEIMKDTHFRELDAEQYKAKMRQKFR
ncbi:Centrosomal protein, partial [Stegodyphus mimosarum]